MPGGDLVFTDTGAAIVNRSACATRSLHTVVCSPPLVNRTACTTPIHPTEVCAPEAEGIHVGLLTIRGGNGGDVINATAWAGEDRLYGGNSDDRIYAGVNAIVSGGCGHNLIVGTLPPADTSYGTTVSYSEIKETVTANLSTGVASTQCAHDKLVDIDRVEGGEGFSRLTGSHVRKSWLEAGTGSSVLIALGPHTIIGGEPGLFRERSVIECRPGTKVEMNLRPDDLLLGPCNGSFPFSGNLLLPLRSLASPVLSILPGSQVTRVAICSIRPHAVLADVSVPESDAGAFEVALSASGRRLLRKKGRLRARVEVSYSGSTSMPCPLAVPERRTAVEFTTILQSPHR